MATSASPLLRSKTRVFIIEHRAGPTHVPEYLDFGIPGAFEQPFGDVSRVEVPSSIQYGAFEAIGEIPGSIENATLPITYQSKFAISRLYDVSRRRCAYDVQVHAGQCEDPRDFDTGWQVILVLEQARSTTFKTDDLGAMMSGDNDKVTEEMDTSALRAYYIGQMSFSKRAESNVTAQIVAITVCDKPDCGECGAASNGCEIVFALSDPAGSSPGLLPEVVYTDDGYTTAGDKTITTFAIGENPDDATCVGVDYVVVSADTESMHIIDKDDMLDGAGTWTEVATGFVATKGPQAIDSVSPRDTFIVGKGGYVYFTSNPRNGVTVQDAGVATTQDLNDVDAFNTRLVVAVGDSNAVIFTENGGDSWGSVTGPAVGVNLTCVAIRKEDEWWVGTATGKLYFTTDKGQHWTESNFNGSGAGSIADIKWASDSVGFLAHNTGTAGRILRTISGGNTWYPLPESASDSMPTHNATLALGICLEEVNVVYAGGQATGGADGVIIKGTPHT